MRISPKCPGTFLEFRTTIQSKNDMLGTVFKYGEERHVTEDDYFFKILTTSNAVTFRRMILLQICSLSSIGTASPPQLGPSAR